MGKNMKFWGSEYVCTSFPLKHAISLIMSFQIKWLCDEESIVWICYTDNIKGNIFWHVI